MLQPTHSDDVPCGTFLLQAKSHSVEWILIVTKRRYCFIRSDDGDGKFVRVVLRYDSRNGWPALYLWTPLTKEKRNFYENLWGIR